MVSSFGGISNHSGADCPRMGGKMSKTVITYRISHGGCVGPWRATLCAACARARTNLVDVQHGKHAGTCDDCELYAAAAREDAWERACLARVVPFED